MQIDEYVPTSIPNISGTEKLRIESTPNIRAITTIVIIDITVVKDVLIERLTDWLILLFTSSARGAFGEIFLFSLILS